jgi:hypothetical protein
MTLKERFNKIAWRLQFKKITLNTNGGGFYSEGRCTKCDAVSKVGLIECVNYGCPCKYNQQLKRIRTFKFLYDEKE